MKDRATWCCKCSAILIALLSCTSWAADAFTPGLAGKKLISYGADWPNTTYVRQHIGEMEKHPFDGVVIGVSETDKPEVGGATLGLKAWGKQKFDAKDYQHAIDDLKATHFVRFTDNFIQVEAMPGDVNFFAPEWDAVIQNFRILAHVAKKGGCVGLEFDPEEYSDEHVWSPALWSSAKRMGYSEQQYIVQARVRGQQLMRAINEEFPGIKILCLFGPSLTASYERVGDHNYRLLAPFIEGMCRGADAKSEIIDGYESSYGFRTMLAFEYARRSMLVSRELFDDKAAFDRVMHVGFGLWTDNNSGQRGWFPDQPEKNHFQPATWQNAVNAALMQTDRYVWVWRERFDEWEGTHVGAAYEEAQRAARSGSVKWSVTRREPDEATKKLLASVGPRDWQTCLGSWLDRGSVLVDLATPGWSFRIDGQSQWSPIEIGKFWEEQGWDYDGIGWYRRKIDLPAAPEGKVTLVFGGVDEVAQVSLNGEVVGEHDIGDVGWDQPFSIDLTGKLRAGANELLVRVIDLTGPGGIWRPAAIFVEHSSTTKGKKLIEYGWDCPDTAFVREHVREMENRPFDGVVIRPAFPATLPSERAPSMGRIPFRAKRFEPADFQHCIVDLAATKFEKFTDNFIQVLSQPSDIDWFDDARWEVAAANVGVLAKIARAGKCVGLMLDPEEYGSGTLWELEHSRGGHSEDELREMVRQRGEQFIRAVNAELPNAIILCLFGPSLTFENERAGLHKYALLPCFVEGMCRAGDAGTKIIDGFEQSYMYRTKMSFEAGRRDILLARQSFGDAGLFDRKMRVGFGLWIDNGSNDRPWDAGDFANNYFQPATWQNAIHFGLSSSDEYVWVYSQTPDWWTGKDVVPAYEAAQVAGRESAAAFEPHPSKVPARFVKHASASATQPASDTNQLLDLSPGPWAFAADANGPWSSIEVGKFWGEQGWDLDGYGWYRRTFRVDRRAKKMFLHIGAADESATVWLNGREVGTHDIGEIGWDRAFEFDVTQYLKPGDAENELTIRVLNRAGPGGLWKTVTLTGR